MPSAAVTKERNTLLKLVIGMAIGGYGYEPTASRSDIPKQIAQDLDGLGIRVHEDRVRNRLKEGYQEFGNATMREWLN